MSQPLYLDQNVKVEPLVDNWYAWSHLIPPATYARNLTERHLTIMDSYVASPQVHADAVRTPSMIGGPFIDYDGQRVEEIRALRDQTACDRRALVELSAALTQLQAMLDANAVGYSLHPMYAGVPAPLKGYVELTYDANNHPSFRLLEPLLYRGPYYDTAGQSVALSRITGDDRPFVLSTPRLAMDDQLMLAVPFRDERLDELFRLKVDPQPYDEIRRLFDLRDGDEALFRSFFTEQPPPAYASYQGKGLRWRYFGHACILVETEGVSILFDPVLSYTYESSISRYTYADLPDRIDFVIITHNHIDHVLLETLLQIRHKVGRVIVPRNSPGLLYDPSLRLTLQACGFDNVVELEHLDTVADTAVSITALPFLGEHGDLDVTSKLGYLVRGGGHSFLFAADSCNVEPAVYSHIQAICGDVDVLFLGMECSGAPMTWFYGPLILHKVERAIDGSRRLSGSNFQQAMNMVEALKCREVYVYAMGQEPWLNYVMSLKYTSESLPIIESNRLIAACAARDIPCERLFGEKEIVLDAPVMAAVP